MGKSHNDIQSDKKTAILTLRVTPRASRNEILEILTDGTVKVRITASPVQGKANEALLKFLSEVLDIQVSHLEITSGAGGRTKLISVMGMDVETLHNKIAARVR